MKKNILLLFPDQHRGDWLPYDDEIYAQMDLPALPIRMDNLRHLMENGTTFTRAVTNSPLCAPARACLASGMDYDRCGVYNNDFSYPLDQRTFYSVLKDGGYNVGGVGKLDLHKPILYWGVDGWIGQLSDLGFTSAVDSEGKYDLIMSSFYEPKGPYSSFLHENGLMEKHAKDYVRRSYDVNDVRPTDLPDYAYSDNWVTQNALQMLDGFMVEEKPWFVVVNFTGPHNPWDITDEMKRRWEGVRFPSPHGFTGDPETANAVRQNYAAMLENIDRNIGLILDKLRRDGTLEDTLIIYCSDHGDMLGDHDRYFKSVAGRGAVNIPLVVHGPGIRRHVYTDALVQLNDLAATFAEYAGLSMPEGNDSQSILPIARGEELDLREYQVSALYHTPKGDDHRYYGNLVKHRKQKLVYEIVEELNQQFHIPKASQSIQKMHTIEDWKSVITPKYKLVMFPDAPYELYDLEKDPWEMKNIAAEYPEMVESLRGKSDLQLPSL